MDISKIKIGTITYDVKDANARTAISNMPSAASTQTCEDIVDELT